MNYSSIKFKLLGLVAFTSFLMLVIVLFLVPPRTKALAINVMEENAVYTAGLLSENLALGMQILVLDHGETTQQTLNLLSKGTGAADFIEQVVLVEHQKRLLVVQLPRKDSGGKVVECAENVYSKASNFDKIAISNSITHPVDQAIEMHRNFATGEGDLTKRLTVDAKGEIGELARWSNSFVEKV